MIEEHVVAPEVTLDASESTPAPQIPQEDLADKFAKLAKQEKRLRAEKQAAKETKAQAERLQAIQSKAKESPLDALVELGTTYEQLMAHVAAQTAPEADNSVEAKLAKLEAKVRAKEEAEAIAAQKSKVEEEVKLVEGFQKMVYDAIADTDTYSLIHSQNMQSAVIDIINAHYQKFGGKLLTPKEAADKLEAELEEQALSVSQQLAKKKSKQEQRPEQDVLVNSSKESAKDPKTGIKSLTSDISAALQTTAKPKNLAEARIAAQAKIDARIAQQQKQAKDKRK